MRKSIKERAEKTYTPSFSDNLKKKEKDQIIVRYKPVTLGEWEAYAANSETQMLRLFSNHISFYNLVDPETKEEILNGGELMESTYAPFRMLLLEVYSWVISFFSLTQTEVKN